MRKKQNTSLNNMSSHEILQGIQNGTIDPASLPKPLRQLLVEVLLLNGQTKAGIAKILGVTDRTIRRDAREIWERNAMTHDPEFAKRFIGEVRLRAMTFIETLTRAGHSSEGKPSDKNKAIFLAWRSLKELVQTFQSLGHLPTNPRRAISTEEPKQSRKPDRPKRKKISEKENEQEKLRQDIEAMFPMERERLRSALEKRILELSKSEIAEEVPPPSPAPEPPPPEDDEDPGAACGAAT